MMNLLIFIFSVLNLHSDSFWVHKETEILHFYIITGV